MIAKLKIKGEKEFIELSFIEGKTVEKFINDSSPGDTPFSIEGIWTGKKSQMDSVKFVQSEKNYDRKTTEFTREDAFDFETEIADFFIKGSLSMEKEMELLSSKKLIRMMKKMPDGECKTITDFDWAIYSGTILQYISFQNRLDAWKTYRAKQEFVENEKIKDLEKMAEQIT